jgi:RNA polymerase sigma-70 factor (ECF subfamily)
VTSWEDTSDAELAKLATMGDDRAFSELVRRHKDPLFRLLRRYAGNPDDAYEAVQEAFISAWSALDRYDPSRPFGAWLRTIAINKARDRSRRAAVRRLIFSSKSIDDAQAMAIHDMSAEPEQNLTDGEEARRLDLAISRLPANLKEPLLLTVFEGNSQQAAADILRVSVKTIETRVARARKKLSVQLGGSPIKGR